MKILMIVPSLSARWGGTTTSVLNFYNSLSKYDAVTCKVISTVNEDEENEIDDEVVNNDDFILFSTNKLTWRYSKDCKDYLNENIINFDIIWIHSLWTSTTFYAAKYARIQGVPYIVSPHGMLEPAAIERKWLKKKLYWLFIEKKVFDYASAIHCITKAEALYSRRLSKTATFVIPNGVMKKPFKKKNYKNLNAICFVGRFHEKKALDLLIRAIAKVKKIKLLVAGDGDKDYRDYIYSLVEFLNIKDRVEFKGFANKKIKGEILDQSYFLVLPSHTEGLSMVGIESIMSSTPVLTTINCNFCDVQKYNAGIVMDNNEPDVIHNNIMLMLESDIELMSRNAHKLAIKNYSCESHADAILNKLESFIKNNLRSENI